MQAISGMEKLVSVIMNTMPTVKTDQKAQGSQWSFVTNHFCVLLTVAKQPDIRISEIADVVGITERATHRILMQLVEEGYLSVRKSGRRNFYEIHPDSPLRHPIYRDFAIKELLNALSASKS
jgi:DNA-binding MarR family transcriptional regulator